MFQTPIWRLMLVLEHADAEFPALPQRTTTASTKWGGSESKFNIKLDCPCCGGSFKGTLQLKASSHHGKGVCGEEDDTSQEIRHGQRQMEQASGDDDKGIDSVREKPKQRAKARRSNAQHSNRVSKQARGLGRIAQKGRSPWWASYYHGKTYVPKALLKGELSTSRKGPQIGPFRAKGKNPKVGFPYNNGKAYVPLTLLKGACSTADNGPATGSASEPGGGDSRLVQLNPGLCDPSPLLVLNKENGVGGDCQEGNELEQDRSVFHLKGVRSKLQSFSLPSRTRN